MEEEERLDSFAVRSLQIDGSYCRPCLGAPDTDVREAPQRIKRQTRFPLAVVFDIDGTLIAEGKRIHRIILRPGVVDFLFWLKYERCHRIALWTAAHSGWAHTVARRLCEAVEEKRGENQNNDTSESHVCSQNCRVTFDFVWDGSRMRRQSIDRRYVHSSYEDYPYCQWCRSYRFRCNRCECHTYGRSLCPCRFVKDMRRIWHDTTNRETQFFRSQSRTLIVENTPQQCIYNYGNAIYVPTYRGGSDDVGEGLSETYFVKMKQFILTLETVRDVRCFRKCNHDHSGGMHACFEQTWWTDRSSIAEL